MATPGAFSGWHNGTPDGEKGNSSSANPGRLSNWALYRALQRRRLPRCSKPPGPPAIRSAWIQLFGTVQPDLCLAVSCNSYCCVRPTDAKPPRTLESSSQGRGAARAGKRRCCHGTG